MADTAPTVIVEEKSAWFSKIAWTQILTVAFTLLAAFGVNIPDDLKVNLMTAATSIGAVVTIIWKIWFTQTITPSSASKL